MAKISIPELAKLAGVSIGTVDRALHNRPGINPKTREEILRLAAQYHYRPNKLSKALAQQRRYHFLVVTLPTQSPFTQDLISAAQKTAHELEDFGVRVSIEPLSRISPALQAQMIQRYLKQRLDGLALEPIDHPQVASVLQQASQQNVPVITFNTDMPASGRLCYVGQDNFKSGKVAADLLCRFIKRPGSVLILHGSRKIAAHQARVEGFCAVAASDFSDVQIAAILETQDNEIQAYRKTMAFLQTHPHLAGIYVAATGSRGAADALRKMHKAHQIRLVCHDIVPKTVDYLRDGIIDATLLQNPQQQGQMPLRLLFDYVFEGKKPPQTAYFTAIEVLTKNGI